MQQHRAESEFSGWWGGCLSLAMPVGSHTQGLSVLLDGRFNPSPGICGVGVYGFACEDCLDSEKLGRAWDRTVTGGYNGGCVIVFKPCGILIKAVPQDQMVPLGSTAWLRDQFSTNVDSVEFMSITFHLDGLAGSLQKQLDALGSRQKQIESLPVAILFRSCVRSDASRFFLGLVCAFALQTH